MAAVVAFVVATWLLFVSPAADADPARADAVVVLGSFDGRLQAGLELMEDGLAPVLVLSTPGGDDVCVRDLPFEVLCREPDPFTTRGEAQMVRDLAEEEGWDSIVVATSTHHVSRARLLFDRCFEGDLQMADAGTTYDPGHRPLKVLHEWGGMLDALLVSRGC